MNNKEVSNPKTEVPTGMELNDKDYIGCLLSNLKCMEKNYTVSLTEASNEILYQQYFETFQRISNMQREVYEFMFRNGWYKLEKAEENKINKKLDMLNQEKADLNS